MRSAIGNIENLLLVRAVLLISVSGLLLVAFLLITPNSLECCFLRQLADQELLRMETTPGEPTKDSRVSIFSGAPRGKM